MSLYKSSSLVMIPSAYKDGKLYSIRPTDGSGDFTFSRGSNLAATRVDVNGLIEKGRENLLPYSNSFSNSNWTKARLTLTSGQTGYDGSTNAWNAVPTSDNNTHALFYNISGSLVSSGVHSFSFYAKGNGYNYIVLRDSATTDTKAKFDLSTGATESTGSAVIDSKITSVGNGWYRCEFSANRTSGGGNNFLLYVQNSYIYDSPYVGDTTSGVLIQDAQVEQGLVATDYIETGASTAQAGILEDMPRLDYSGGASCPALLLEPQRTNIVTQSDANANWNMVANVTNALTQDVLSPEGVYNAWSATRNASSSGYTYMVSLGLSPNTTYTASVWLKAADLSVCNEVNFNLHSNSFASKSTILSFEDGSVTGDGVVESYPNGWYRVSLTSTSNASIGYFDVGLQPRLNGSTYWGGSDGDVLFYAYGTQVEAGSYPTSYIPTYGSSVTRSADSCLATSVSDLIGQTEGTLFAEIDNEYTAGTSAERIIAVSDGSSSNRVIIIFSGNGFRFIVTSGGSTTCDTTIPTSNIGKHKLAMKYNSSGASFFIDGVKSGNDPNITLPSSLSAVYIGKNEGGATSNLYAGNVKQSIIFPTALTDSECIALTTL